MQTVFSKTLKAH